MEVNYKEGMLYLQGVKFGKKTWRKMWALLFKPSPQGVGRLELYTLYDSIAVTDQKKLSRQKTPERKVVRLSDCLSVTPAPKESCPRECTAFYVNTTKNNHTLASTESQDWISALCLLAFQKDPGGSDKGGFERGNGLTMEDNDLYSSWEKGKTLPPNQYQVTVQSTEASRRCQLAGEYLVSPEQQAVILLAVNTGHIIYHWPYKLLRKFGQVEGGFSIEAGRRCESGEGMFIFLSRHAPQIFQTIWKQCSVERSPYKQPLSARRSSTDQSLVSLPTVINEPAGPPVYNAADDSADTDDESTHYSTIKAVGQKCESDDERCHSLEAVNLDDPTDDSIYCNLSRATPPVNRKELFEPETDGAEAIYSDLKIVDSPLTPEPQALFPPLPPPPPCALSQSVPCLPKPRFQSQPSVNNYTQPGYDAEAQAVDDMKEMEEAISSPTPAHPAESLGSFKHRLAEIISKDLAKFHPPPPKAGSPTFSQ